MTSNSRATVLNALEVLFGGLKSQHTDPTSSINSVADIESELNQLAVLYSYTQQEIQRYTAQQHKHRNSLLPIHSLPREIFNLIVDLCIPTFDSYQFMQTGAASIKLYYTELLRLRYVCNTWRAFIDSTPAYWTIIGIMLPQDLVSTAIHRSGQQPLQILCRGHPAPATIWGVSAPELRPAKLLHFASSILPHKSRWKTFVVDSDLQVFEDALQDPIFVQAAALLGRRNALPWLFEGQASNLKHLTLSRVDVDWESPALFDLTTLDISSPMSEMLVTQLRHILRNCPDLEELRLREVKLAIPSDTYGSNAVAVDLPFLQTLHISDLDFPDTDAVIKSINSAHSLKSFHIEATYMDGDIEELLNDSMSHLVADLRLSFLATSDVTDGFKTTDCTLFIGYQDLRLNIKECLSLSLLGGTDSGVTVLYWLAGTFGSDDQPLTMHIDLVINPEWRILLSHTALGGLSLRSLRIKDPYGDDGGGPDDSINDVDELIQWLGKPKLSGEVLNWQCPELILLEFEEFELGDDGMDDRYPMHSNSLRRMILSRYGLQKGLDTQHAILPSKIKLNLEGITTGWRTARQLIKVVGLDNLEPRRILKQTATRGHDNFDSDSDDSVAPCVESEDEDSCYSEYSDDGVDDESDGDGQEG